MCSQFLKRMDNFQGDLTDIIRATGGNPAAEADAAAAALPDWQFPMNYSSCPAEYFGDPFTQLRDPLLLDVDNPVSELFHASDGGGFGGGSNMNFSHHSSSVDDDQMMKRPNFFSRLLQISPSTSTCESPAAVAGLKGPPPPPMLVSNDHQSLISTHNSKSCLVESPALQISSPRNTGISRRKSQAKKVVCIPAPAPANSRPSGEIVPSDLWAWRKYGQKPIKGSPYPRGYYRCSSSKGCSARKQVERSRNDPNMLVITYTSEHNHPWPTQRNALAGSTRSQPSKTTSNSSKQQKPTIPKDEEITTLTLPPEEANAATTVKEEMEQDFEETESDQGFPSSYKPTLPELPESNQSEDSFFADLGEIEGDSLDQLLLFDGRDSKGTTLDPFTFYDWGAGTTTTATSYGEAKRATETTPLTKKGQPYTPSID